MEPYALGNLSKSEEEKWRKMTGYIHTSSNPPQYRAVFPLRCATAQNHQSICAVQSHSRALIYHSPSTTWHGCAIACSLKQNLFSVKFSWRVHWCRADKGKRGQGSKKPHIFGRVLQPLRKTFLMEIFQGFFPSATYLRLPLITVLDFWCKRSFMHSIWQGFYGVGKVWKNVLSFSSLGKSGKKFMVRWFFIIFNTKLIIVLSSC